MFIPVYLSSISLIHPLPPLTHARAFEHVQCGPEVATTRQGCGLALELSKSSDPSSFTHADRLRSYGTRGDWYVKGRCAAVRWGSLLRVLIFFCPYVTFYPLPVYDDHSSPSPLAPWCDLCVVISNPRILTLGFRQRTTRRPRPYRPSSQHGTALRRLQVWHATWSCQWSSTVLLRTEQHGTALRRLQVWHATWSWSATVHLDLRIRAGHH